MDAPTKPTALALDVGGTWVKSAPVTSDGQLLEKPRVAPIDSHADAQTIFGTLADVINYYLTGDQAMVRPSPQARACHPTAGCIPFRWAKPKPTMFSRFAVSWRASTLWIPRLVIFATLQN
ncbi:MAG: hypothetical protein U0350_03250 [Caldilineaceae bacterium]